MLSVTSAALTKETFLVTTVSLQVDLLEKEGGREKPRMSGGRGKRRQTPHFKMKFQNKGI